MEDNQGKTNKQLIDSMKAVVWIGIIIISMGVLTIFLLGVVKAVELIFK